MFLDTWIEDQDMNIMTRNIFMIRENLNIFQAWVLLSLEIFTVFVYNLASVARGQVRK